MNNNTLIKSPKSAAYAVCYALLLCIPLIFSRFVYAILISCFILLYVVAVSGLDIVFGYCGQISTGHAAFFAIGAYGSCLMHAYFHLPIILTMVLAAVLAGRCRRIDCVSGFKTRFPLSFFGYTILR